MVNISPETSKITNDNIQIIKAISGGDAISIDKKYASETHQGYLPTKLIITSNNIPYFTDTSFG